MSHGPCCAHVRIESKPREHKGGGVDLSGNPTTTYSEHWACESCGALFVPGRAVGDAVATERLLHPNGRCGCAGEGRCQWCLLMQTAEERDAARQEADDLRATQEPLWAQMRSVTRLFGAALEDGAPINAAGASLEAVRIVVGTAERAAGRAKAEAYGHAATLCDERRAALGTQDPGAETQLDDLAADLRDLVRRAVQAAAEEGE